MSSNDVRYERDIYTWLTSLDVSQYYFMFKAAGLEKIRDILYIDAEDIRRLGIEDDKHVRKMVVGVRHIVVPDKLVLDNRTSPVWQSGRLIVDIYAFLDYTTLIEHMAVSKQFRHCLNRGVRRLTVLNPVKMKVPMAYVIETFSSLTMLNAWKLGPEGAEGMAKGLKVATKGSDAGSHLLSLNMESSRVKNKGIMAISQAMGMGAMTRLQKLNLSTNNILHKGVVSLARTLSVKRHRALKELSLSYNGIGDPGVTALAEAINVGALPALECLKLCSVGMSDNGFAELCEPLATRCLLRLQELDVRWNPKMGDRAGKRMLVVVAYQGTPNLQLLKMRGHKMSPRVVKMLTEGCDGYFDIVL